MWWRSRSSRSGRLKIRCRDLRLSIKPGSDPKQQNRGQTPTKVGSDHYKSRGLTPRPVEEEVVKVRSDQVSGLLLLALAVFVGWENRTYPLGSLEDPGPGYTPLVIAVFLGIAGLLIALKGASSRPLAEIEWPE